MDLVERDTVYVCGWAVETDAGGNDRDIGALYADFFGGDKHTLARGLAGDRPGWFGLTWYTDNHERYRYLLGVEVGAHTRPPVGALAKTLPPTRWAVASYPAGQDIMEAWSQFYFTDIPQAGWAPDDAYNFYFEYYPTDVHADFQLWVPVVPVAQCPPP